MKVREIAYSRSGDKGDISNVCVFAYDAINWPILRDSLTVDLVRAQFKDLVRGSITRYDLPKMWGMNFVMESALGGGVSMTLRADPQGRAFATLMLEIDLGAAPPEGSHAGPSEVCR